MLSNIKKRHHDIKDDLSAIFEEIRANNQQILAALENHDMAALAQVQPIAKADLYQRANAIDASIIKFLALFTPEAKDLRELVAFLKMTYSVGRLNNNQRAFIKNFPQHLSEDIDIPFIFENVIPLQRAAVDGLNNAVDMIHETDEDKLEQHFKQVVIEESRSDDLYKLLEKSVLKKIDKDLELANDYQELLAACRLLEKIADRAFNLGNLLKFAKLGGEVYDMGDDS